MEQKLEERVFWFLEPLENARCCIQINRNLGRTLSHYAARWCQKSELFQHWQI